MLKHEIAAHCIMSELAVTPAHDKMHKWRLVRDFPVHIRVGVNVQCVTVPSGFITDFASVPRIFHPIIPPLGRYGAAALVHDYLCVKRLYTRKVADQIFLDLMMRYGVKKWRASIMYGAVRLHAKLTGADRESTKPRATSEST